MVDYELDELRREFLGEARDKGAEMRSATDGDLPADLERIAYLAHQLKGSGGSYGFPTISDQAAELEKQVESAGSSPDAGAIRASVVRLVEEIDRCATQLGEQKNDEL